MRRFSIRRSFPLMIFLLIVLCGTTFALMFHKTEKMENQFALANVTCKVEETFTFPQKSMISVRNTGNIEAYLRLRLVTYWVDADGNILFKPVDMPAFTLGENWIPGSEDTYYYALPVEPNAVTGDLLASDIILKSEEKDGCYQVVEVFADAIQSKPRDAVTESWEVKLNSSGNITYAP